MNIKEIEERSGLTRANIRYYEQEGLLAPARRENKYRDYSEEDLETLLRIALLRSLGFAGGQLKGRRGTPEENLTALDDALRQTAAEKEDARQALAALGDKLPDLQLCSDRLNSRLMREENRKRLLTDGCIVAFDGWIPAARLPRQASWLDTLD